MTRLIRACFTLSLTALLAPLGSADLISWGPVREATQASDVSTRGFPVAAVNLTTGLTVTLLVNGVVFTPLAPTGWTTGQTGLLAGSTTQDAGYDALLDGSLTTGASATTNPTEWGAIRIDNLVPLTLGSVYEVQVWFNDQHAGTVPQDPVHDRAMRLRSAIGSATLVNGYVTNLPALSVGTRSGPLEADANNLAGPGDTSVGHFVTGTFRRTTATPLWILVQGIEPGTPADLRPELCAIQLREFGPTGSFDFCVGDGTAEAGAGFVDCPCGNNSLPGMGRGCVNSNGFGARLTASGTSLVALDNLQFAVAGCPASQVGLLVQGRSQIAVPFRDGLLCVGAPTERMEVFFTDVLGQAAMTDPIVAAGNISPGMTTHYQAWYRNPGGVSPCGTGSNFTQGVTVSWD